MSKQYGLIIPGRQKKEQLPPPKPKPSIFHESSSSDEEKGGNMNYLAMQQSKLKKPPMGPGVMDRRMARDLQEKALAEDPTIFQYDELYDDMENKRLDEQKQNSKKKEPQKPKYIAHLMKTAEKRKLENELRIERQIQKERDAEGDKFKDKESFVTSSYRKKLEEMRKLEQQNERENYLETIGDVRKQQNLDGFYRHIYEQKLGSSKESNDELPTTSKANIDKSDKPVEELTYKPIVLTKPSQRTYRKRKNSEKEKAEEDGEESDGPTTSQMQSKRKEHLANNIDADSDFSIDDTDSGSSSDNEEKQKKSEVDRKQKDEASCKKTNNDILKIPSKTIAINLDSLKKAEVIKEKDEENDTQKGNQTKSTSDDKHLEALTKSKPKDKTDIWRKRTVGAVFEAAVQRYFERRAARNAA